MKLVSVYGVTVAYLMWKLFCMEPIYLDDNEHRAFPNFSTKHFLVSFRLYSQNDNFFRNTRKMAENLFEFRPKTGEFEKFLGEFEKTGKCENKGTKK